MSRLETSEQCLDYLGITTNQWGHSKTGPVILELIDKHDIKSFVEVGSQTGYLSELIARIYPTVTIYCIDVNFHRPDLHQQYNNILQIVEDSTKAADRFENTSVDMVYIDAEHTYEAVKSDLTAWLPKTKKIISGHDYKHGDFPGCSRAIDEFFTSNIGLEIHTGNYYNWWSPIYRDG